jgi:hypothetical protein
VSSFPARTVETADGTSLMCSSTVFSSSIPSLPSQTVDLDYMLESRSNTSVHVNAIGKGKVPHGSSFTWANWQTPNALLDI